MARILFESPITTRASRATLKKGVHWRGIDTDIHLGCRKGRRGGAWLVRWYTHENRCYQRHDLGVADDVVTEGTPDYAGAVKAVREAVTKARLRRAADASGPVLTVRLALETYLTARNARQSEREAGGKLRRQQHSESSCPQR